MPNAEGKTTVSFTIDRDNADNFKKRVKDEHPNERIQSSIIQRFMDHYTLYGDYVFEIIEKNG